MEDQPVLVTGGSGFIAGHCIMRLLQDGYRVRTTVRDLRREQDVRASLTEAGVVHGDRLSFVAADLTSDTGWAEAVAGCRYVLHVASPVHMGPTKSDDDVIAPARDGALRVLRAARDAGVSRVVLTSAFHAVGFGHPHTDHVFTEQDWSIIDGPGVDAYGKSKILAERAAWDFIDREGSGLELTTLLPVAVMGPVLGRDVSGANHIVQRSLAGKMPGYPNMYVPIVDVRDVAQAHVVAMTAAGAGGQRILVSGGQPAMPMKHIGEILRQHFGTAAAKVPTRTIPDFVVRLAAVFKAEFRPVAADLHFAKQVSDDKARRLLTLSPRSPEQAVVDSARSMIDKALI